MQHEFASLWARTLQYTSIALLYLQAKWSLTVYPFLRARWIQYWYPASGLLEEIRPHARYFLGFPSENLETYLTVPKDTIYIEEWIQGAGKKYVVRYEGETIPRTWTESPLAKKPRVPWIWVGDRETELDLTRTFDRFLVVGNRITKDLVSHFIHQTEKTNLIFIESGTFKELKFPGDGLTIEEYVDRPVPDSRTVHAAEEAVCAPVVGGHNDTTE